MCSSYARLLPPGKATGRCAWPDRAGPSRRIHPAVRPRHSVNPGWTYKRREGITMSTTPEKTVLITGANVGIGKEIARQMALRPEIAHVYLACRNKEKARTAKAELETETGRRIFDIVLMDVSDPASVRA